MRDDEVEWCEGEDVCEEDWDEDRFVQKQVKESRSVMKRKQIKGNRKYIHIHLHTLTNHIYI
jgi:hypothetical protein